MYVASRAHITFVDEVSGFVQPVPVEEVCFFVHLISALLLIIPRLPFMMSNHCRPRLTAEDVDHLSDVVEEAVDPIDDEDDPDIVEWFSGLEGLSTGNYHPFPSKIFALLLGITVPSLASVKTFQLPDMREPVRVMIQMFFLHVQT